MGTRQAVLVALALLTLVAGCSERKPPGSTEADVAEARARVDSERRELQERRVAEGRGTTDPLRAAAERGDPAAQTELGGILAYGELLPQDYVEAYKWLSLAAAQGNETARFRRDAVATELSPAELAEAGRRVQAWQPARSE